MLSADFGVSCPVGHEFCYQLMSVKPTPALGLQPQASMDSIIITDGIMTYRTDKVAAGLCSQYDAHKPFYNPPICRPLLCWQDVVLRNLVGKSR
jgi:hypothetical protein